MEQRNLETQCLAMLTGIQCPESPRFSEELGAFQSLIKEAFRNTL